MEEKTISTKQSEEKKPFNWPALTGLILAVVCLGLTYWTMGFFMGVVAGLIFAIAGLVKSDHYGQKVFAIISVSVVSALLVFLIFWAIYDGYSSWWDTYSWRYKN